MCPFLQSLLIPCLLYIDIDVIDVSGLVIYKQGWKKARKNDHCMKIADDLLSIAARCLLSSMGMLQPEALSLTRR